MNNYYISITEYLSRTIAIQAKDADEAVNIAKELYHQEKIILDSDDYCGTDFEDMLEVADDYEYSIEDIEGDN